MRDALVPYLPELVAGMKGVRMNSDKMITIIKVYLDYMNHD